MFQFFHDFLYDKETFVICGIIAFSALSAVVAVGPDSGDKNT